MDTVRSPRPSEFIYHVTIILGSIETTFDEDATLKKSRRCHLEEVYEEESIAPRVIELVREVTTSPDDEIHEYHDMIESQEPPQISISHKRNPAWERELIQYGQKYGAP